MFKNTVKSIAAGLTVAAAVLGASAANAAVINFGALPGSNGDTYTSYTESGFTLESIAGTAYVGKSYGGPVPSVFFREANEFRLSGTGTFIFNAIDFASHNGSADYTITGFLNGGQAWTFGSSIASNIGFVNVLGASATAVDYVTLMLNANGTSANLDNIDVDLQAVPVPEPVSLALFGLALAGAGIARRRRA